MSTTKGSFAIAYVLLVLLPLAGLLAVLRHGRHLTAPVSVDGMWKLQGDASQLAVLPCGKAVAASDNLAFTISQSGAKFTLSLINGSKASGEGMIEENKLNGSLQFPAAGEAGCDSHEVNLMAAVDPKANPRTLSGTLSVAGCPSCSTVEFRAVREAPAVKKGGY